MPRILTREPGPSIDVVCRDCGKVDQVQMYCPYTGHRYGEGFEYICECRGTMEVQNDKDV